MSAFAPQGSPRIGAVVVTYHPDAEFAHRLAAVVREIPTVVIVDNSGPSPAQEKVRDISGKLGCELIANRENAGLARALNQGFAAHAARGIEWAVAFDQDSTPEADFAETLIAAKTGGASIAVVGANWSDEGRPDFASRHLQPHRSFPVAFQRRPATEALMDVTCVITSGSLFSLAVWRQIGGFREDLFLDLVDTDYCLRAAAAGHRICVAGHARLRHRRAAKRPAPLLGHVFWPAFMAPLRLRYLFRNRVRLIPRHGLRAPHWVAFELAHSCKILGEVLFLEPDKTAKVTACIRGCWDGIRKRGGRIEEAGS